MEIELELLTTEKDEIRVMEKLLDLARRAKELGFSIKELELETEEDEEEKEIEEETVE
jgi:tetraacyldisaccharide-1-P 4'-kinase